MDVRKINAENLAILDAKVRTAEAYTRAMEKLINYDILSYDRYNAKRGTSSLEASGGGKAERKNMVPSMWQKPGKPIADIKPSKGMTGYHL